MQKNPDAGLQRTPLSPSVRAMGVLLFSLSLHVASTLITTIPPDLHYHFSCVIHSSVSLCFLMPLNSHEMCHSTYVFSGSLVELIATFSLCNSSNSPPQCGLTCCGAALISDLVWCTFSLSLLSFTLAGDSSPLHCPPFAIALQIEPPQVCESLSPLFLSLTTRILMSL